MIELENGVNYYILEELTYNNKKYALAVECDLEKAVNGSELIVLAIPTAFITDVCKKLKK